MKKANPLQLIFQTRIKDDDAPMVSMFKVIEFLQGWHDDVLTDVALCAIDQILCLPRFSKGKPLKNTNKEDPKLKRRMIESVDRHREIMLSYKEAVRMYNSNSKCQK